MEHMPTSIMSEEMEKKAEEAANKPKVQPQSPLYGRLEQNVVGLTSDVFMASIAISLRRIADSLDVIANAE